VRDEAPWWRTRERTPQRPPGRMTMDTHSGDWSTLVTRVSQSFGLAYDPAHRKAMRPKLIRLLTSELPHVERDALVKAADDTLRDARVKLDWHRFLCMLLSQLPGWWVKLTNDPGFKASTMLLLTDGTVMCQQEGGLNWKKLTPDSNGSYINGTWSDL